MSLSNSLYIIIFIIVLIVIFSIIYLYYSRNRSTISTQHPQLSMNFITKTNTKPAGLYVVFESKYYMDQNRGYDMISHVNTVNCNDDTTIPNDENNNVFCKFDTSIFDQFRKENWYFNTLTPIILLSIRNLPNFVPIVYENIEDLPPSADHEITSLRENMKKSSIANGNKLPKCVWVSCSHIWVNSPNKYTPQGFPVYYFPTKEHIDGYYAPLLPIQLKLSPGENIIICKMWAKNINIMSDPFAVVKFRITVKM